jgi:hypothetical protein
MNSLPVILLFLIGLSSTLQSARTPVFEGDVTVVLNGVVTQPENILPGEALIQFILERKVNRE